MRQAGGGDRHAHSIDIAELSKDTIRNSLTGLHSTHVAILSINADAAKFDHTAGVGHIVDNTTDPLNPLEVELTWPAEEAVVVPLVASTTFTSVYIIASATPGLGEIELVPALIPGPVERRGKIFLGSLIHIGSTITTINNVGIDSADSAALLHDLVATLGDFKISGLDYSANGSNLLLDRAVGEVFGRGINVGAALDNPNMSTEPLETAIGTYLYNYRPAGAGAWLLDIETAITPGLYDDDSGTPAVVASNRYTVQRLTYAPRANLHIVEMGQVLYTTMNAAVTAAADPVEENPALGPSIFWGCICVKGDATDLTDAADCVFVPKASTLL